MLVYASLGLHICLFVLSIFLSWTMIKVVLPSALENAKVDVIYFLLHLRLFYAIAPVIVFLCEIWLFKSWPH
jgi:hypothetical protein